MMQAQLELEDAIDLARGVKTGLKSRDEINAWCKEIHAANVAAGWWNDLETGACIKATRNRGECLMLVVSELAEAGYGHQNKLFDDKLPHYPMFDVELADTLIRIFDLAGADKLSLKADRYRISTGSDFEDGKLNGLMIVTMFVADAMEGHRKRKLNDYEYGLTMAVAKILKIAEMQKIDLQTIMREKITFNASRADHKPENRKADGGKKS